MKFAVAFCLSAPLLSGFPAEAAFLLVPPPACDKSMLRVVERREHGDRQSQRSHSQRSRSPEHRHESRENAPSKPEAPAETPPTPYDGKLRRLAEVLGGLSYLRDLCGDGDGDDWREKLARLREADSPTGARRERLTASFNRGFRGYELTYRVCTPNARTTIARYLDEADRLARDITVHYGNP